MFKQMMVDDWANLAAIATFAFTAGVFIFVVIRAIRMSKQKRDHMANLPLSEEPLKQTDNHE